MVMPRNHYSTLGGVMPRLATLLRCAFKQFGLLNTSNNYDYSMDVNLVLLLFSFKFDEPFDDFSKKKFTSS